MAKIQTLTCDICNESATLTLSIFDSKYDKEVVHIDLCDRHYNLLRSYLRHGCPVIKDIEC